MTITGRAVAAAALAVPLAIAVPAPGAWMAWLVLVLVALAADVALAASPRALVVRREVAPSVRLGQPVASQVTVTNTGRRPARGLVRDAWQPSAGAAKDRHRLDVPPGERRRVTTQLRPTRRGDRIASGVTLRCTGPLGLAARQLTVPEGGRLRVLPPFHSRKHLPSRLARLRELDGRAAVRVRGQGTEFDSLRDYVDGDDVRSIDWRATARRQAVVVRTWRPERERRVLLVLDTSRTSAARIGDEPRLDAAMDAALLLAALASRAGDRVDLLAVDRVIRARVEHRTGADLLPAIVDAMAPLEPALVETDWSMVAAAVRSRGHQRSLVVLLTSLDAASVDEGLLPVVGSLTGHHLVCVASVADPGLARLAAGRDDSAAVYAAAAAERTRADRHRTGELLARHGVEVVDAGPDGLAPALADRYLALKAAGRL